MTSLGTFSQRDATSAAGPMRGRQGRAPTPVVAELERRLPRPATRAWQGGEPMLVGLMLAGLGTSSLYGAAGGAALPAPRPADHTLAGASTGVPDPAGPAIAELRRLTGLTWDQLARLFGVSRRSLHFWASGKAMTPRNEEHLQRLLAVVRKIDRGSISANRTALLGAREDGAIPFDLLAGGQYERVLTLLGPGGALRVKPPKLSPEAWAARAPRPPEELVGALQDRVHEASGRLRAARAVRVPRRT